MEYDRPTVLRTYRKMFALFEQMDEKNCPDAKYNAALEFIEQFSRKNYTPEIPYCWGRLLERDRVDPHPFYMIGLVLFNEKGIFMFDSILKRDLGGG